MGTSIEEHFFSDFRKKVQERLDAHKEYVASGAAEDYANYRERVGAYTEAKELLRIYEDLLKAINPY